MGLPTFTRQPLARAVCLALLSPGGHGRVAATMRAVPVILPVTYALSGEDLLFSPGADQVVRRAVAGSVVAFETDLVDADGHARWGVHVTGIAGVVTDESDRFRLSCDILTGWRLGG